MNMLTITDHLIEDTAALSFAPPTAYVYNPLDYARAAWDEYLRRYATGTPEILLLGMNPGPFGMAQVGVPFGDIPSVRDWLGIETPIGKPAQEHPKRPIQGFACPRREVSGSRLWGWAQDTYGTPDRFFDRFFVANYCPLCFMEETGRNRTPDKLPAAERAALFAACDRALRDTVTALKPRYVLGIGAFAERRAKAALEDADVTFGRIPHPSPASPLANRGWAEAATKAFHAQGIRL